MAGGARRYQIYLKNLEGNPIYAFLLTMDKSSEGDIPGDVASTQGMEPELGEDETLARQLFQSHQPQPPGWLTIPELNPSYNLPTLMPNEGVFELFDK